MTRKDLEANLGRKMYLRLFDGEEITGRAITGSAYMDCQRPGKSVEKLSKL